MGWESTPEGRGGVGECTRGTGLGGEMPPEKWGEVVECIRGRGWGGRVHQRDGSRVGMLGL